MYPTINILITALSLVGFSLAAFHPLKRQTPAGCSLPSNSGYQPPGTLAVRPLSNMENGAITYVGIVPGVQHEGIDGSQDSILVTKDSSGNPLQPQIWEYVPCQKGGIVRPQNATQHCIAVESKDDEYSGSRNSVLDSYCSQVPEQYRTFVAHESGENYEGGENSYLYFISQNMTVVIGNTAHGELQFFTDDSNPGGEPMQLQLIFPHVN